MAMNDFDRVFNKLDQIDAKLDNHLARLSKSEEAIDWIRGHIRLVVSIGLSIALGLGGIVMKVLLNINP